jgi:hypothetical protein
MSYFNCSDKLLGFSKDKNSSHSQLPCPTSRTRIGVTIYTRGHMDIQPWQRCLNFSLTRVNNHPKDKNILLSREIILTFVNGQ